MNIWIEPCGCGITEFNKDGKEVVRYRHDKASFPDGEQYSPMTAQTDGVDANGSPIQADWAL